MDIIHLGKGTSHGGNSQHGGQEEGACLVALRKNKQEHQSGHNVQGGEGGELERKPEADHSSSCMNLGLDPKQVRATGRAFTVASRDSHS